MSGDWGKAVQHVRSLFHPRTLLLSGVITVPLFFLAVAVWIAFFSLPAPTSDDPGYLAVEYLLSSVYSGSSNCKKIENEIGQTIAQSLIECSGWGYSMRIRNIKNGYELYLPRLYKIEFVSESQQRQEFMDSENHIAFEVVDGVIQDFYPVEIHED